MVPHASTQKTRFALIPTGRAIPRNGTFGRALLTFKLRTQSSCGFAASTCRGAGPFRRWYDVRSMTTENSHKPRIGVPYRTRKEELTGKSGKMEKYLASVRQAGGEPVAVSLGLHSEEFKRLAATFDAVLLPGRPADVDPARFGAGREPKCADPDPDRERTDFALLEHCFAEQKPLLAICFGIQSL